ncbi:type IV secretory system conjugative DNA transfer family protein [Candidatus Gracilibacteria bacterium]|nr:type IV secretory system conjugative DNA transfer family protein [Candidatus Gracilibacteria bacterium]NJM89142.1 type IV secretory system conjugative DNA transfer family protein [Hydrococcus sp. RU_2_2]NJP19767.1 type IV secretory system conjugative DNA transfer family protein [Hydrococcus sp. CRU_1_1]
MKLLFNDVSIAAAIAQYLQGDWDEFNAVLLDDPIDEAALRRALVKVELNLEEAIEYCREGEFCSLFAQKIIGPIPIFGYSNSKQLISAYGSEEFVRAILSTCATRVIFNPQELASAEEFVERL